jgi:hypothetical protein
MDQFMKSNGKFYYSCIKLPSDQNPLSIIAHTNQLLVGTETRIRVYTSGQEKILQQIIMNITPEKMYFNANKLFVILQPYANKQQVAVYKQTSLKISWVENGLFDTYDKESNMVDCEGSLLVNACKTSSV